MLESSAAIARGAHMGLTIPIPASATLIPISGMRETFVGVHPQDGTRPEKALTIGTFILAGLGGLVLRRDHPVLDLGATLILAMATVLYMMY